MNDIEYEKFEGCQTIRIYKIVSTALNGWCYVGSTKRNLKDRWWGHKYDFKRWQDGKGTSWISWFAYPIEIEDYDLETFQIELILEIQVDSNETRFKLEGQYIIELQACNKCIMGRNFQEYYQENHQKILEYQQEYYQDNRKKIREYQKQYYEDNKENFKERYSQYYLDNQNKIREYQKQYFQNKQKEIIKWQKQKQNCLCGGKYTNINKAQHEQSKKHKQYLQNQST